MLRRRRSPGECIVSRNLSIYCDMHVHACRQAAEERMSQVVEEMEKQLSQHAAELQKITDQLLMQKELATKYSVKVLELEKDGRLKTLTLKDIQKDLVTEKAVSSKFYDEVLSAG